MKRAVVLLSGGLDSTTCLALASSQGYDCFALSFRYGQRHDAELHAAKRIAERYQVKEHRIFDIPVEQFVGSALTDSQIAVPDYDGNEKIPITYVPARNTIFLAVALGWAEILSAYDIFIGVSAVDYSGYPDCRPEFITAFQRMADVATKAAIEGNRVRIQTPLIHFTKAETIRLGLSLDVDYRLTVSCYNANAHGKACGRCDSCYFRQKGFKEAGIADATLYQ